MKRETAELLAKIVNNSYSHTAQVRYRVLGGMPVVRIWDKSKARRDDQWAGIVLQVDECTDFEETEE